MLMRCSTSAPDGSRPGTAAAGSRHRTTLHVANAPPDGFSARPAGGRRESRRSGRPNPGPACRRAGAGESRRTGIPLRIMLRVKGVVRRSCTGLEGDEQDRSELPRTRQTWPRAPGSGSAGRQGVETRTRRQHDQAADDWGVGIGGPGGSVERCVGRPPPSRGARRRWTGDRGLRAPVRRTSAPQQPERRRRSA